MNATRIEWCDMTINPVVGCSHCSIGCLNCYAERFAARLAKNPKTADKYAGVVDEHGKWTGCFSYPDASVFRKVPKTPKRIFVGSMTDIFHPNFPRKALWKIFSAIENAPYHTFMFLTKRADSMREYFAPHRCEPYGIMSRPMEIGNLWLGVTVCNQEEADAKIPVLLSIPAAKRFVSIEPMLGEINFRWKPYFEATGETYSERLTRTGKISHLESLKEIDWVIAGGETGPGARPAHPDWFRGLRDQCREAGVPFFFKGFGDWLPIASIERGTRKSMVANEFSWKAKQLYIHPDGYDVTGRENGWINANIAVVQRVGKRRAGRLLDGREWNEIPGRQNNIYAKGE
jgi:protein gp37